MSQFLIVLSPCRDTFVQDATEDEQAIVARHFEYLTRATEAGAVILVGRSQDEIPIGLVIFEAESDDAARKFMAGDPAIAAGVFKAELRPYKVALMRR